MLTDQWNTNISPKLNISQVICQMHPSVNLYNPQQSCVEKVIHRRKNRFCYQAADLFIFYIYFSCVETCFWSKPQVATEGTADFGTFALPYFFLVWGYSLLLALWSIGSFWICAKGHEGRAAQIYLCAVHQGDQAAHTPVFCHTAPRWR